MGRNLTREGENSEYFNIEYTPVSSARQRPKQSLTTNNENNAVEAMLRM